MQPKQVEVKVIGSQEGMVSAVTSDLSMPLELCSDSSMGISLAPVIYIQRHMREFSSIVDYSALECTTKVIAIPSCVPSLK